jgi:hypothetical protein
VAQCMAARVAGLVVGFGFGAHIGGNGVHRGCPSPGAGPGDYAWRGCVGQRNRGAARA